MAEFEVPFRNTGVGSAALKQKLLLEVYQFALQQAREDKNLDRVAKYERIIVNIKDVHGIELNAQIP